LARLPACFGRFFFAASSLVLQASADGVVSLQNICRSMTDSVRLQTGHVLEVSAASEIFVPIMLLQPSLHSLQDSSHGGTEVPQNGCMLPADLTSLIHF